MYKLTVYVPKEAAEKLKDALFAVGAGRSRFYDQCCWQTAGISQFRPLEDSNPAKGDLNRLMVVQEIKLEMLLDSSLTDTVISTINQNHPYEFPAWDMVKLSHYSSINR